LKLETSSLHRPAARTEESDEVAQPLSEVFGSHPARVHEAKDIGVSELGVESAEQFVDRRRMDESWRLTFPSVADRFHSNAPSRLRIDAPHVETFARELDNPLARSGPDQEKVSTIHGRSKL
jgi:hypothetical protein